MSITKKILSLTTPSLDDIPEIVDLIRKHAVQWEERNNKNKDKWKEKWKDRNVDFSKIVIDWSEINVDILTKDKKPAVQWYFNDWLGSNDCDEMDTTEFASYHWLLYRSANADIQAFLPFRLDKLKTHCRITQRRFIRIWNHILSRKFKFAKHKGEIYIYNPRLFAEIMKLQERAFIGYVGGKIRALVNKQEIEIPMSLFKDSPYFNKGAFTAALLEEDYYKEVDSDHYYERMLQRSKNKKAEKQQDWLAFTKTFILNDGAKVRLKKGTPEATRNKLIKSFSSISRQRQDITID